MFVRYHIRYVRAAEEFNREYFDYFSNEHFASHLFDRLYIWDWGRIFGRLGTFVTLKRKVIFVRVYATEELIREYYLYRLRCIYKEKHLRPLK